MQLGRSTDKTAKAPRRTQSDRREAAEQKLLDAAIRLIARRGVKGTTLGDIGEAAGFSRALTGHHYKSKTRVIKAVIAEIRRRFSARLARADIPAEGLLRLTKVIEMYLEGAGKAEIQALHLIQKDAMTMNAEFRGVMRSYNREAIRTFAGHLREGMQSGEVRCDIDPDVHASLLLASLRGVQAQWLLAPDRVNLGKVASGLVVHLKRSIGREAK